ncbi:MAG TPA: helix-turn-helix domain-containing protein [Streptosporangiaceae bacterium]|nr:helix-turn-helix domain-containing protein [Streptosporangiaceae bacterium]
MPGRAADLIEIPGSLWQRAEMIKALRERDIGRVFHLLHQYAGLSQTRLAIACDMTQPKISGIMRGIAQVEHLDVFERIANGLDMPDPARVALGLAPKASPVIAAPAQARQPDRANLDIPSWNTRTALDAPAFSGLLSADPGDSEEDETPVQRRAFVGLTGASLFGAILADNTRGPADSIEPFAVVLAAYSPDSAGAAIDAPPDMAALAAAVARAKRDYQACRYADVTRDLPPLLTRLQAACAVLDAPARFRAYTLSAEAHHVAASVLLKVGDQGLGWLAADRSMQAARASQDPVTVASSARIVTHAMMSGGHLGAATSTASNLAARLDHDVPSHNPESLSVYGSLLLRGAVAAAQHDDRGNAHELLTEAEDAGRRLGEDRNLRWTAFGPTNAKLHRVNIAVTLGDAGTAIDVARTVDLDKITVTERKATFLIDTARAFLQCGKHEKAYLALRAAQQMAPEEIAGRVAVHRIVLDLITTAPPSIQRQAEDFGQLIGVTR